MMTGKTASLLSVCHKGRPLWTYLLCACTFLTVFDNGRVMIYRALAILVAPTENESQEEESREGETEEQLTRSKITQQFSRKKFPPSLHLHSLVSLHNTNAHFLPATLHCSMPDTGGHSKCNGLSAPLRC